MKERIRVAAGSRRIETSAVRQGVGFTTEAPPRAGGDPFDATLNNWQPGIGSADRDWLPYRDTSVARTRNIIQNEPWAQAGLDAKAATVIGRGWLWSSRPNAKALGLDPASEEYKALADSLEQAFEAWGNDPAFRGDYYRSVPFGIQLYLIALSLFREGEGLALVNFETDRSDAFKFYTTLQLMDPDRLSNPDDQMDDEHFRGGIELDDRGRPVRAHFRKAHPGDVSYLAFDTFEWESFNIREHWGRPRVIHIFDRDRVDQHRGVSRLVSMLRRFKVLQSYTDAELKTAALNATVFATIYSDGAGEYLSEAFGDQSMLGNIDGLVNLQNNFYKAQDPRFAGSRAVRVFPGDRVDMHTQGRANAAFGEFTTVLLRSLAAGLGLTYEQLTKDFSKTNYSSARAAMIEAWRIVERERKLIQDLFADQVLLAVLEEAFDRGEIEVPAGCPEFWEAPAAYIKGRWIAPAKGSVDMVKEGQGNALAVGMLQTTYDDLAAEAGRDLDDVIASQVRILKALDDAGLSPARISEVMSGVHSAIDGENAAA